MSSAARSVYVFGIYLIVLGGILIGSPNTLLTLFGIPTTTEPWIRVVGMLVMVVGMLDIASARGEQTKFMQASVYARFFVLLMFVVFAATGIAPAILILFGVVDAAGAIWTHTALKSLKPAVA